MSKKDGIASFIIGLCVGAFLLLIIPNVQGLSSLARFRPAILIAVPLIFLGSFWIASLLSVIPKLSILKQVGKFGMVGVLNTSIDFGIFNFLITTTGIVVGASLAFLNIISFSFAVVNSFFWNRLWVFEDRRHELHLNEFFSFLVVSIIAVGLNSAIVLTLSTFVPPFFGFDQKTWINIAKVFATLFSLVWNFLGYKFIVFKKA